MKYYVEYKTGFGWDLFDSYGGDNAWWEAIYDAETMAKRFKVQIKNTDGKVVWDSMKGRWVA